ncbi:MAG: hypothetical protein ACI8UO_005486 [Verrucomicrobiales bacterium]|jgi:hypothetical protein
MADSSDPKPLDLSSLQLAPDWVSSMDTEAPPSKKYEKFEDRGDDRKGRGRGGQGQGRGGYGGGGGGGGGAGFGRERSFGGGGGGAGGGGDRRGGGGGGGERRGPGGGGGGGDRRGGGPGGDRRGGQGGGRDQRDSRGRGGFGNRDRDRAPREEFARGITAKIRATRESVAALAGRIKMSGRAIALFDLAKMILEGRERFEVVFGREDEKSSSQLVRCKADGSLWMNEEDAIRHFLSDRKNLEKYYTIEETKTDGPKGNFNCIAVCGLSGQLLGPPNYHGYQPAIQRMHRQRFADMPIERYKAKIRTETSEELVAKWREQESLVTNYLYPKTKEKPEPEPVAETAPEAPEKPEVEAEAAEPPVVDESAPVESNAAEAPVETPDAPAESESADPPEAAEPEAEAKNEAEPEKPAEPVVEQTRLDSLEALERHFRSNLAAHTVRLQKSVTVPGGIPAKQLAPGLLSILRREVEFLKRSPFPLVKVLCGQLERSGLKIFKHYEKKLYAAKARPRAFETDTPLSDGIVKIIQFIEREPGVKVSELVTRIAPRPPSKKEEEKAPEAEEPASSEAVEEPKAVEAEVEAAPVESKEEAPSAESEPAPESESKPKGKAKAKTEAANPRARGGELTAAETAILSDLHWLIDEGFIIEFALSELHLGVRRGDPNQKKKRPKSKSAAAGAKKKGGKSKRAKVKAGGAETPSEKAESAPEAASEKTEPVAEASEVPAEKTDPVSEAPEATAEKTEPVSEAPEAAAEKTEPVSEAPEAAAEKVEPVAEAPEAAAEKTEPASEAPEAAAEKTEPVAEASEAPAEKAEPAAEAPEAPAEKTEPVAEAPEAESNETASTKE